MTITEFSNIAENKLSDKIINAVFCIIAISLSLFFQIKYSKLFSLDLTTTNFFIIVLLYTIFLSLMGLGFYGLFILIKPLKVSHIENKMTKDQNLNLIVEVCGVLKGKDFQANQNIIHFTYKKSFWSYKQRINFLVEDNLIAIYIKNIDTNPNGGFLDFGAKSRFQKKVFKLLKK